MVGSITILIKSLPHYREAYKLNCPWLVSEMEMDKQQPPAYGAGVYPNQPYPNQPYPNQPYPQQPYPGQPGTTVVTGVPTQTVIVQQGPVKPQSYMILSCFVFWCCNCLFGGIAFIFSSMCTFSCCCDIVKRLGYGLLMSNVVAVP